MSMLVDCSNCRTQLQLPNGAKTIICAICHAITHIADPRYTPPPPYSAVSSNYNCHPPPPSPNNHLYPPPSPYGPKRAVICGICYKNSRIKLEGCINDAIYMRYLLINRFNFPQESILMLTEEEVDPCRIPTKQNIRRAMSWLVQGCKAGDSLVFHFSGHGSQRSFYNGDEVDGYDETICPLDFETEGNIVDDEINNALVRPLPRGAKLHAIIDSCHSGTVLDLTFLFRMDRTGRYVWEDHRPRSGAWKGSSGGEVISFSGCDDSQTSFDTYALAKVTSTGVLTFCFIQAIVRGEGTTYGSILNSIRSDILKLNEPGGGVGTPLHGMLLARGSLPGVITQEPQLSATDPFDVYAKKFSL